MDYRHPKLQTSQTTYILRPVSSNSCSSNSPSAERYGEKYQPVTNSTVGNRSSQSEAPACVQSTRTDVTTSDVGLADSEVKLKVPGISAAEVAVDGNSVEMPSATTCQPTESDDVTMLSARRVIDGDVTLKAEICQDIGGINSDRTDTTIANDIRTNSAVGKGNWTSCAAAAVVEDSQLVSNSLVVNTNVPQAADAKARIKAALLNSGRRRQRLGE